MKSIIWGLCIVSSLFGNENYKVDHYQYCDYKLLQCPALLQTLIVDACYRATKKMINSNYEIIDSDCIRYYLYNEDFTLLVTINTEYYSCLIQFISIKDTFNYDNFRNDLDIFLAYVDNQYFVGFESNECDLDEMIC